MDTMHRAPPLSEHWAIFERHRRRLVAVANRILGSSENAEDLVQDAALRWLQTELSAVRTPEGWLITMVKRLAIDRLRRSITERRCRLVLGPEERINADDLGGPREEAEVDAHLACAFRLMRAQLEPADRAAFALRELFDCGYSEIAYLLGKSASAWRQHVHRARKRLRLGGAACDAQLEEPELARRFVEALRSVDRERALALLALPRGARAPGPKTLPRGSSGDVHGILQRIGADVFVGSLEISMSNLSAGPAATTRGFPPEEISCA